MNRKSTTIAATIVGIALACAPAIAREDGAHRMHRRIHALREARPVTIRGRHGPSYAARPAYDPYQGPQAIITGPVWLASSAVALPFSLINAIFPPDPRSPLVLVGGPVYAAGWLAQVPFRIVEAPFRDSQGYPAF